MQSRSTIVGSLVILACCAGQAPAGVIFGFNGNTLGGGYRWDAAPRSFVFSGNNYERSLNGGLRFSLQGGSYQAYRDRFSWDVVPTVPAFTTAVNQAFGAWTGVDPASGLPSGVNNFVADFATVPVGVYGGGLDSRGAEIDLFGFDDGFFWNPGDPGMQGETRFNASLGPVQLTSGTVNYPNGGAITGADIILNNSPQAVYDLNTFRRLLAHEIGHAIGLGDVEGDINPGAFIDDNFSPVNSATANATLNNSWAALVNAANPAASPLLRYTVPFADPGTTTAGVNILMESRGLGIAAGNPVTNLSPMTNDDYGTRQFLYPMIPAPATLSLLGLAVLANRRRRA